MVEYDKDAIVYPYITDYLRKEIPERSGILKELEEYAEKSQETYCEASPVDEVFRCSKAQCGRSDKA